MYTNNEPDSSDDGYGEDTQESEDDLDSTSDSSFDEFENDAFDWSVYDKEEMNSESIEEENEFEAVVKQSLIQWVVDCNIPRSHVSNLLKRLHCDANLTFLPLDSRTLLSSKRGKIQLMDMPPGKYQHFDVAAALLKVLEAMVAAGKEIPNVLNILVNIDGIPLSKSSSSDFWPILIKVLGEFFCYVSEIIRNN
jgi:hypothetical protein